MKVYTTLRGSRIDLDELAPWELALFWGQLRYIGNFRLLFEADAMPPTETGQRQGNDSEVEAAIRSLPDPDVFESSWRTLLDSRLSSEDRRRIHDGPLSK